MNRMIKKLLCIVVVIASNHGEGRVRQTVPRLFDYPLELVEQAADFLIQQTLTPYKITQPGVYALAESLTLNGSTLITISSNDVVLNLNGKTLSGTTIAIAVIAGINNVIIRNGFIAGTFNTGISVGTGCTNITLQDMNIGSVGTGISMGGVTDIVLRNCYVTHCTASAAVLTLCSDITIEGCNFYANGLYGIDFEQSFNGTVSNCKMGFNNAIGMRINQSYNIAVNDSTAYNNNTVGFELLQSYTNILRRCQALDNGGITGTGGIIESGFYSSNGIGNIFESCIANGTTTTATDAASQVAGFALIGSEQCSKIVNCESGNTTSPIAGSSIPYGILIGSSLDNLNTVTGAPTPNATATGPLALAWHPNSQFIAAGIQASNPVLLYEYNRTLKQLTLPSASSFMATGSPLVGQIAWSPDGNYLAAAGTVGTDGKNVRVYILDRANKTLTILSGCSVLFNSTLNCVAWSLDGRYLAISGASAGGAQVMIYLFNSSTQTLTLFSNFTIDTQIFSVAWSPDGNYLATGDSNSNVAVSSFDKNNGACTVIATAVIGVGANPLSLIWSKDEKYLVIGQNEDISNNTVRLFSFNKNATPTPTLTLLNSKTTPGFTTVQQVVFSPNNLYVAAVSNGGGFSLFQLNRNTNQLVAIQTLSTSNTSLNGVSWSPDGRYIAYGGTPFADSTNIRIISALLFPINNLVMSNKTYCNVGNQYPGGIGIGGSSIQNFIAANTSYQNTFNYEFVTNTYTNGLDGTPSSIQNISVPPFNAMP